MLYSCIQRAAGRKKRRCLYVPGERATCCARVSSYFPRRFVCTVRFALSRCCVHCACIIYSDFFFYCLCLNFSVYFHRFPRFFYALASCMFFTWFFLGSGGVVGLLFADVSSRCAFFRLCLKLYRQVDFKINGRYHLF